MAPSRKQVRGGARPEYMSFGAIMWSANRLDMWGRHVLCGPWLCLVWHSGPAPAYEIPIILENRSIRTKYPYMPANSTAIKSKGFGIYSLCLGSVFPLRFGILKSHRCINFCFVTFFMFLWWAVYFVSHWSMTVIRTLVWPKKHSGGL